MQAIETIMVPVNFSELSRNAFVFALKLGSFLSADVSLLNSVPPAVAVPDNGPFNVNFVADLEAEAEARMSGFIAEGVEAAAITAGYHPQVTASVKLGDLRAVLRDQVAAQKVDLIVMGTHGRGDGWDELLGTNASFVLSKAPCPLLIVPDGVTFTPPTQICFTTDLRHVDAFFTVRLMELLKIYHPTVNFLHVRTGKEDHSSFNMEMLENAVKRPDMDIKANFDTIKNEDIAPAIFQYAREKNCDLVIMSRPERSWLERLFSRSSTRLAAMVADRPLLVFSPQDLAEDNNTASDTGTNDSYA